MTDEQFERISKTCPWRENADCRAIIMTVYELSAVTGEQDMIYESCAKSQCAVAHFFESLFNN